MLVRKWRWWGWLGALVLLSTCQVAPPVVKIGLVAPFEGAQRPLGYDVIYSARLAVRQANQQGTLGPYRVALVALDDSGDPDLARQTAEALALDPALVAVLGHWLPDTNQASVPIYRQAQMPHLVMGQPPFGAVDPAQLPASFHHAYEAVTPFDEVAGRYAGTAYDAFTLLLTAMRAAYEETGRIERQTVGHILPTLTIDGLTGRVARD